MSKNLIDKMARSLGYIPKAEMDDALDKAMAHTDSCNAAWRQAAERLKRRHELLRIQTRGLFQTGVDLGRTQCPSAVGFEGGVVVARRTCRCSPLQPICAYNACLRGLQITEHPIE